MATAMKILGAAASKKYSFERCVEIGKAVNEQLVSIGSALDHCNVPGRQNHDEIGDDVCVVGAGIHNEPVRISKSGLKNDKLMKCRERKRFPLFRQSKALSHSY